MNTFTRNLFVLLLLLPALAWSAPPTKEKGILERLSATRAILTFFKSENMDEYRTRCYYDSDVFDPQWTVIVTKNERCKPKLVLNLNTMQIQNP